MPCCVAYGCFNRTSEGMQLPSDNKRRDIWTLKVKRDKWKPSKFSVLYQAHFEPKYYDVSSTAKVPQFTGSPVFNLLQNKIKSIFQNGKGQSEKKGKEAARACK